MNFIERNIASEVLKLDKKITVLTISDHPLLPSGVGTQTKYIIEALLKSGKFNVISLGGAVKHQNYTPTKVEGFPGFWEIFPVDGYGDQNIVRTFLKDRKPDILYFMTDPRFYGWLWEIEDEIRKSVPMIYYHVWDNKPYPVYNDGYYQSNDFIACISKVTHDIVKNVSPNVKSEYVPHAVNSNFFKLPETEEEKLAVESLKLNILGQEFYNKGKKIFFWNNRNARRKQSGSLVFWFKDFIDQVGKDKATLVMHTDPLDPHGQNLNFLCNHLGLTRENFLLSTKKLPPQELAKFYQAADYTINISDAEGFGLATLESLSCGTPIIVTMTGGLQEQVTNGKDWFGYGIKPSSKAIIGSQTVPFIYEDRISRKDFLITMRKAIKTKPEKYNNMVSGGLKHVKENYSFESFENQWVELMQKLHEENGSWETRKNYKSWECIEI